MLKELDTYDWKEAFAYASGVNTGYGAGEGVPRAILESKIDISPFNREDVAEIIASSEGVHDELDWLMVMKLKDGRFASLKAGCDYTGWD